MAKETTVLNKEYALPSGDVITLGRERFMAPEILMNPGLIDLEDDGLAEMIYKSITSCAMDI